MSIVISYKHKLLHSVAPETLLIGCAFSRHGVRTSAVWGFLLWLRIFLGWLGGNMRETNTVPMLELAIVNRRCRRVLPHSGAYLRERSMLYHLFGRGLSRRQFMEKLCKLSLSCRVRIYGIWSWGNVLVRRARLVCYDHGWWHEPIGEMGCVRCGVWRAHLWPEWRGLTQFYHLILNLK